MVAAFPVCARAGCTDYAVYGRSCCADHCADRAAYEAEAVALLTGSQRLQGLNLSGVHCRGLDLRNRELLGCRFSRSVWDDVRLDGARMRHVSIDFGTLRSCSLCEATVTHCVFAGAVVAACELRRAELRRNNFVGLVCTDTCFRGSDLTCCRFIGARLQRVDLQDCNLYHAHFESAALTDVDLRYCNVEEAHLPP